MGKKEVLKNGYTLDNVIVLRSVYDKVSDMKYFI